MTQDITTTGPSRRSIAKGAAWAVPAVSVAAAAPSLAASPPEEECDDCVVPVLTVAATSFIRLTNPGRVTVAGGLTFSLNGCTGLVSAGLARITQARLTVSRRNGDSSTHVSNLDLGIGIGAGGLVVIPNVLTFNQVNIPSGFYLGGGSIGNRPSWPSQLCFTVRYTRLIGGQQTECSQDVCFTPSLVDLTVGTIPGTVVFATAWS